MTDQSSSSVESTEVSFAEVASEDPADSVAREAEAIPDEADADAAGDDAGVEGNAAPAEPTITSLSGGGVVADGDQLAP